MARKTGSRKRVATVDSLSNLAASLGAGKDKAANDAFFVADLARDQIEAMYRGDWLARKVVDIVPYDSIREWREWAGPRAAVEAIERTERRLGLRKALQRAMTMGRLYGGAGLIVGTAEDDPSHLAAPLYPEAIGPGGVLFLHAVSRWQLSAVDTIRDPLDPCFGEPTAYRVVGPDRGDLLLHPSRVVRFLGNPLPDPLLSGAEPWSDSVLQSLYDAIHAVAVTGAGATSLVHEAKVDIVTVPGLSEHLSNAATTAQLSARFSYAAAMKSINNLLLLGDGESWARQSIDFAGLPEMVRTFLQVAAGAADIPVTRLLGQSPAGLSATGDSDTRNYYDMIAARQELDLRPQLERLDALLLRSAGVDPGAVRFSFRPLWQLSASERAAVALQKAQTTAVYAGLTLWPAAVTAALVQAQLLEDGTYPNAAVAFGAREAAMTNAPPPEAGRLTADFDPDQARDPQGRWTTGGGAGAARIGPSRAAAPPRSTSTVMAAHVHEDPINPETPEDEEEKQLQEKLKELDDPIGGPRGRPDGTVSMPAPGAPSGSEGTSRPPAVTKPEGIPDHWIERPSDKKGGTIWFNPDNRNQNVRAMPGDPGSPYPHQRSPYVVHQDGSFRDVEGRPISGPKPGERPEAHIPARDFRFRRRYLAPDRLLDDAVAAGRKKVVPEDMRLWMDQIRDEVDSIADESVQRGAWFGIGPVADSPTELFCRFFDNAAVVYFLEREDNGLTEEQAAALSRLTVMMHALSEPETDDPHVLIDDPRWQAVREQAAATLNLLDGHR